MPNDFSQGETLAEIEDNIRDAYDIVMADSALVPAPVGTESKMIGVGMLYRRLKDDGGPGPSVAT